MRFSICIPTWEQHGYGTIFLNHLLNTIDTQTFTDYEVIISDHSVNDNIYKLILSRNNNKIKYFKFSDKYGNGVSNTNNSLKQAEGEIIKIMFQDDFFYDNKSLEIIDLTFNNGCKWLVNACNHTTDGINVYRDFYPKWNDNILYGQNTISSPSVLSFINEDISFFDENLTMLMDVEYYHQLFLKYGTPYFLNKILITNRLHEFQISSMYDKNIDSEIDYVKNKYNK